MSLHDYIDEILGSRASIGVLKTLLRYRGKIFTIRELARTSGLSHPEVSLVVRNLEGRGVLRRQVVGRAHRVVLNEDSYVLRSMVEPLVKAEENTLCSLASTIRPYFSGKGVTSVALFGSVSKGAETRSSDIDILIIADNRELASECAARASSAAASTFGRGLSPLVMSRSQFVRSRRRDLVGSILKSYIMVYGRELTKVVEDGKISR